MKYPIIAYGDPVLRRMATNIEPDEYPHIKELVDNMFETMYAARGVGLAAPQVGMSMRLFVVDASPFCGWQEWHRHACRRNSKDQTVLPRTTVTFAILMTYVRDNLNTQHA